MKNFRQHIADCSPQKNGYSVRCLFSTVHINIERLSYTCRPFIGRKVFTTVNLKEKRLNIYSACYMYITNSIQHAGICHTNWWSKIQQPYKETVVLCRSTTKPTIEVVWQRLQNSCSIDIYSFYDRLFCKKNQNNKCIKLLSHCNTQSYYMYVKTCKKSHF